jgi:hypothetical protein
MGYHATGKTIIKQLKKNHMLPPPSTNHKTKKTKKTKKPIIINKPRAAAALQHKEHHGLNKSCAMCFLKTI